MRFIRYQPGPDYIWMHLTYTYGCTVKDTLILCMREKENTAKTLCCSCSFMFAGFSDRGQNQNETICRYTLRIKYVKGEGDEPFPLWFRANVDHMTFGDGLPTTEQQHWKSGEGGALDYLFAFGWRKLELCRHNETVTHKRLFI